VTPEQQARLNEVIHRLNEMAQQIEALRQLAEEVASNVLMVRNAPST
jgi:prefoldin subunit 5